MSEENRGRRRDAVNAPEAENETIRDEINDAYQSPPVEELIEESPVFEEPAPVIGATPETMERTDGDRNREIQEFPREIRRNEAAGDIEAATETAPYTPPRTGGEENGEVRNREKPTGQAFLEAENQEDEGTAGVTEGAGRGNTMGLIGLGLSILALFMFPFILSLAGIITGYIAYRRNARTLGLWAMGIGIVAMLATLVFAPLFR